MDLELAAARWLKWEKKCPLVIMERSPRYMIGEPDVLGITDSRYLLEVEVKRSMSDFRANQLKHHMQQRFCLEPEVAGKFAAKAPKQFWFMVPEKLVEKVREELPEFAGLMTAEGNGHARVVVPSQVNKVSERLSLKECSRLMRCAGNHLMSLLEIASQRRSDGSSDSTYMDDFYGKSPAWYGGIHGYTNFQI